MIKLAIFDLDETLLYIPVDWDRAKAEILDLARMRGIPADPSLGIAELSNALSIAPQMKSEIDSIWLRHETEALGTKEIEKYPKAAPFLSSLRAKGLKIAVCSNNCHSTIERALSLAGLRGFVDFIFGRDDVEKPKPDSQMLLAAMREAGAGKNETVFLGDSVRDTEAGSKAGIKTIQVIPEADFPAI